MNAKLLIQFALNRQYIPNADKLREISTMKEKTKEN